MQTEKKVQLLSVIYLVLIIVMTFMVVSPKKEKPKIDYVQLNDCYQKGYYDGRVAVYGALKRQYVTHRYLDSTFSADSTRFNNWLKVYKR